MATQFEHHQYQIRIRTMQNQKQQVQYLEQIFWSRYWLYPRAIYVANGKDFDQALDLSPDYAKLVADEETHSANEWDEL